MQSNIQFIGWFRPVRIVQNGFLQKLRLSRRPKLGLMKLHFAGQGTVRRYELRNPGFVAGLAELRKQIAQFAYLGLHGSFTDEVLSIRIGAPAKVPRLRELT